MADTQIYEVYSSAGTFALSKGVRSLTLYVEGPSSFGDEMGYDERDREGIAALEIGRTWNAGDYGSWHRIRRIAGPATVPVALREDGVAAENGDFDGEAPLYDSIAPHEARVVDGDYFPPGSAAEAIAANLAVGETWTAADGNRLRRIR